jgi:hypothetical protein
MDSPQFLAHIKKLINSETEARNHLFQRLAAKCGKCTATKTDFTISST